MININGEIRDNDEVLSVKNRAFGYGDCVFDVVKSVNSKIYFWEEHYLRLMSNMRIMRMRIPNSFTMEFLEGEIMKTVGANSFLNGYCKVKLYVFRVGGGNYSPESNECEYVIDVEGLDYAFYRNEKRKYEVELYKDLYVQADLLSNIKCNNMAMNVIASVFAKENEYENCILVNNSKNVVGFTNGNIFLVNDKEIVTPKLEDGCINGITRKKIIEIIKNTPEYTIVERSITPFELQKADEMFVCNSIMGIQSVMKYKKKEYVTEVADTLTARLNTFARLSHNLN